MCTLVPSTWHCRRLRCVRAKHRRCRRDEGDGEGALLSSPCRRRGVVGARHHWHIIFTRWERTREREEEGGGGHVVVVIGVWRRARMKTCEGVGVVIAVVA